MHEQILLGYEGNIMRTANDPLTFFLK